MQYAGLRGSLDGMDPTAITDIARYFRKNMGYDLPPMTPFVGANFNVTRAGIHADGLMKDEEIYNIFDTKKILNRPASVTISSTSGLAGIAYWINNHYGLTGAQVLDKRSELVVFLKNWVDRQYEQGRDTVISTRELEDLVEAWAPGKYTAED